MKETMRPGSRRYGGPSMAADSRPVTGREIIPPDQVRTAPRVTVQAPGRHPGSVPAKNMAATSAARPAADPVVRHVQQSGIPHHRTEPTHRPPEAEEMSIVKGVPLNKKKLAHFSETLDSAAQRIANDPRSVGPEVQKLKDELVNLHLDHVADENKKAMAARECWLQEEATRARAAWEKETLGRPDGARLMTRAGAAMDQYKREHPSQAAELLSLMGHSGLGNHSSMLHFASWAGERRQLPAAPTHYAPNAPKTGAQGRQYGPPSSMSKAARLYK